MSIPSGFQPIYHSCNDGINMFFDVTEGVSRSSLLQSTEPLADPPSYNNLHAQSSNFINSCIFETPVDYQDHSDITPSLMRAFCNSDLAIHGPSRDTLSHTAPTDKRCNHSFIGKQRRKEMKTLFSKILGFMSRQHHKKILGYVFLTLYLGFSASEASNFEGKRADSDQLLGAVIYIRQLKQTFEDLSRKRDRMKVCLNRKEEAPFVGIQSSSNQKFRSKQPRFQGSDGKVPSMKIYSSHSSVKVTVNVFHDQIVYSDLLRALEECGLEVLNATSSSIDNAVFHIIHNKAFLHSHGNTMIPFLLYQNLNIDIFTLLQVSDIDYFKVDDLSEKLWHLVSDNQASLGSLEARDKCLLRTNGD